MSIKPADEPLRFRDPAAIRARIVSYLQLCGEDPAAAFARQYDALPLTRDLTGWTGLRSDGTLIFVDDGTGRVVTDLPDDVRDRALEAVRSRYPEL
jgi:hypothetical protein